MRNGAGKGLASTPLDKSLQACVPEASMPCAVVLASIHKQLMASHTNTKVVGAKRININSEVDSTRVVGAEWVPQQNGMYFVVGHFSGRVYLYSKVRRSSPSCELC